MKTYATTDLIMITGAKHWNRINWSDADSAARDIAAQALNIDLNRHGYPCTSTNPDRFARWSQTYLDVARVLKAIDYDVTISAFGDLMNPLAGHHDQARNLVKRYAFFLISDWRAS